MKALKNFINLILIILITSCSEDSIMEPDLQDASDLLSRSDLSIQENQSDAIILHSKLMDSFFNPSRSMNESESDGLIYPDFYGGCYLNSNNELVILLTDMSKKSYFEGFLGISGIKYEKCAFPISALKSTKREIRSYFEQNPTNEITKNCTSVYLRDRDNILVVRFKKSDSRLETLFKSNVMNSDMIIFEYIEGDELVNTVATDINAGSKCSVILSSTKQGDSSVGYKVKTSDGKIGFIGAAHAIPKNTKVYVGNKSCAVSSSTKWQNSGSLDATFCEITDTSLFMPSNKIEGTKYTLSGKLSLPGVGTIVHKNGFETGDSYGTIESTDADATENGVTFTNLTKVKNMNSDYGDSGGIVFSIVTSTNTVYTVGIVKGKGTKSGDVYYTKAPLINSAFGVSLCQ